MNKILLFLLLSLGLASSCESQKTTANKNENKSPDLPIPSNMKTEVATFGAGCFWCTEAVFQELKGVMTVESGFMGGTLPNPSYRDVCTGNTGHAEVARITFDPSVITYEELLEVFWTTHNPTTLNRQGADTGTQYRSAIFYYNDDQKAKAEKSKAKVAPTIWDGTIVTEVVPASAFYPAEDYHQNYYANNQEAGYCQAVINPKVQKVRAKFKDKLKDPN